ncbi:MAG: hypothetical protein HZB95_06120 [Nitrosomonadales bacterium]|nr:hypothetical protein [Nitrosomonadales bacterium]
MDDDTKKKLILVGVVAVAILAIYYVVSPYQNCVRSKGNGFAGWCTMHTGW